MEYKSLPIADPEEIKRTIERLEKNPDKFTFFEYVKDYHSCCIWYYKEFDSEDECISSVTVNNSFLPEEIEHNWIAIRNEIILTLRKTSRSETEYIESVERLLNSI